MADLSKPQIRSVKPRRAIAEISGRGRPLTSGTHSEGDKYDLGEPGT